MLGQCGRSIITHRGSIFFILEVLKFLAAVLLQFLINVLDDSFLLFLHLWCVTRMEILRYVIYVSQVVGTLINTSSTIICKRIFQARKGKHAPDSPPIIQLLITHRIISWDVMPIDFTVLWLFVPLRILECWRIWWMILSSYNEYNNAPILSSMWVNMVGPHFFQVHRTSFTVEINN